MTSRHTLIQYTQDGTIMAL